MTVREAKIRGSASNGFTYSKSITVFIILFIRFLFYVSCKRHPVTYKKIFFFIFISAIFAITTSRTRKRNIIKSRQTKYTFFIPCLNVYYFREKCSLHAIASKTLEPLIKLSKLNKSREIKSISMQRKNCAKCVNMQRIWFREVEKK